MPSTASSWAPTGLPSTNYLQVGSSPDGRLLLVGTLYGPLYASTNAGDSWSEINPPVPAGSPWNYGDGAGANWQGLATSADGSTWVATPFNGPICLSTNQGVTWAETGFTDGFHGAASSGDGQRVFAVANHSLYPHNSPLSGIYVSGDGGNSWTQANAPPRQWWSVACSTDGTKVAAAEDAIYLSTDSGATWKAATASLGFSSVACSADGTKLLAGSDRVFTSKDSGATWTDSGLASNELFTVATSADGSRFLAAAMRGRIFLSTDSGTTWTPTDAPGTNWYAIASSADGMQVLAATQDINHTGLGLVYTWRITPAPKLKLLDFDQTLALSWIVPSRTFALQQSGDLNAPA